MFDTSNWKPEAREGLPVHYLAVSVQTPSQSPGGGSCV